MVNSVAVRIRGDGSRESVPYSDLQVGDVTLDEDGKVRRRMTTRSLRVGDLLRSLQAKDEGTVRCHYRGSWYICWLSGDAGAIVMSPLEPNAPLGSMTDEPERDLYPATSWVLERVHLEEVG